MNINEAMELLTEANIITKAGHVISARDPQIDISQEGLRAIGKEMDKIFKKFLESNMRDTLPAIRVDIALDRTSKGRKRNR